MLGQDLSQIESSFGKPLACSCLTCCYVCFVFFSSTPTKAKQATCKTRIPAPSSITKIHLPPFCCLISFSSYFLTNTKTHSLRIQKFFPQSALPFYPSFAHSTLRQQFSMCPPGDSLSASPLF